MTPALDHLLSCLDAFDRASWIAGTCAPPTADLAGAKDPAAFGDGTQTRIDPRVRNGLRLRTPIATVPDLAAICMQIEDAFGLDRHVVATLHDVLVYPVGGFFARHKDTPRDLDQLGTLIVELPTTYVGGAFVLHDGDQRVAFDWSTPAANARWLAFYGDVDHEVERVIEGQRNCITYRLTLGAERSDPVRRAGLDAIADAFVTVLHDPPTLALERPIYIPCRRLIVDTREDRPLDLDVLRGEDRAIARLLESFGIAVGVHEIVMVPEDDHGSTFPTVHADFLDETKKLVKRLPPSLFEEQRDLLTMGDEPWGEDLEGGESVHNLRDYVSEQHLGYAAWLVRKQARATHITTAQYGANGYFGNSNWDAHVYRGTMLEIELVGYGFSQRQVKPEDIPALAALQSELTAAELAATLAPEGSIIIERDGVVVGGAGFARSHPNFYASPVIAREIPIAATLLTSIGSNSWSWQPHRLDVEAGEDVIADVLTMFGYRHVLDLVRVTRAPEHVELPRLPWRYVPIREIDAEQLRQVRNETFVNIDNTLPVYLDQAQRMRDTAWIPGSGVWFDRDRIVAFVIARQTGDSIEISQLGIRVDYRHTGLARVLIARVLDAAVGTVDRIVATIAATNLRARHVFEAAGFVVTSLRHVYELTPANPG
ncbi:MAG: GNAT family N-acetyltransferase [Kofleriaceae bacterium]